MFMADRIRIFVTDDHPVVRDGLVTLLETQDDFEIVGQAGSGEETLQALSAQQTDILLLDLEMPGIDGLAVIQQLRQQHHPARIIVFTAFDTDERIVSAIRAGVKGYLLKGASRQELYHAIRVVYQGQSLIQPVVASKLFDHLRDNIEKLTARELEVLTLLAKGAKNKAIADQLFISERTVKFHVSTILSKLGAHNRTDAVQIGIKKGIIQL